MSIMSDDINDIFQRYVSEHAEDTQINFDALLAQHPELREKLQKKIKAYFRVNALLQPDEAETTNHSLIGQVFGGCRIVKKIGQGGIGVAYLAIQENLNREVVLKILRPFAIDNPTLKERFKRESRIIAKLSHPNIVPVYDVGEENGSMFIVMKYVEGMSLEQLLKRIEKIQRSNLTVENLLSNLNLERQAATHSHALLSPATPTEFFCNVTLKICDAIQYAHDNGIIHRDIKPSNIIIDSTGNPILLDFGLSHDEIESALTLTSEYIGTPIYSAPELFENTTVKNSPQLDVYSLGITFYECLSGALPYRGNTFFEIVKQINKSEPVEPRKACDRIPQDLNTILLKAISKTLPYRYQTVDELRKDIYNFLNYLPITARRQSFVVRLFYFTRKRKSSFYLVMASLLLFIIGAIYHEDINQRLSSKNQEITRYEDQERLKTVAEAMMYKRYDQAYKELDQLHQNDPSNININVWYLGMQYRKNHDVKLFLKKIEELESKEPTNLYVQLAKMIGLYEDKRFTEAENLKKTILDSVKDHEILKKIPGYFFSFGVSETLVLDFLRPALEKYPQDHELNFFMHVYCQNYLKDEICAQKYLEIATDLNPMRHLDNLAEHYENKFGSTQDIEEWLDKLEYYEKNSLTDLNSSFWFSKSKLCLRINNCDEAKKNLSKALNLEPYILKYQNFKMVLEVTCP